MLQKIKNHLKRFFPASARTFNGEVTRILLEIGALQEQFEETCQQAQTDLKNENLALKSQIEDQQCLMKELAASLKAEIIEEKNAFKRALDEQTKKNEIWTQDAKKESESLKKMLEESGVLELKSLLLQTTKRIDQVDRHIPNKPLLWSNDFERRITRENWGDVSNTPDFAEKFIALTRGMDEKSVEAIVRILQRQKKYLNSQEKEIDFFTYEEQEKLRRMKEEFEAEIIKLSDHLFAYRTYFLPINHFEASVFYFKHGIEDVSTIEQVKGKAIIDVGGFIGDSVLVLSELSPDKIYTFEAVPENYEYLKQTLVLNNLQNVVAENMSLGAESGTVTIHVAGSGSTTIERPGLNYSEDIVVPATTLDEYVEKHPMEIGLIKVDIEGGEPGFLAGAKKTICAQRPILLLSIYHNAHDFFELKPLLESWGLGYTFKIHKPTLHSATGEILLIAEVK